MGSGRPFVRLEHARRIGEMPMRRFLSFAYKTITLLGEELIFVLMHFLGNIGQHVESDS